MNEEQFGKIADFWGGKGCHRWAIGNDKYGFVSEDGMRYFAAAPGARMDMFEDSGRPAGSTAVPDDQIWVRCTTDAPDALWGVYLIDGELIYHTYDGKEIHL